MTTERAFGNGRGAWVGEVWTQDAGDETRQRAAAGLKIELHRGARWAATAQGAALYTEDSDAQAAADAVVRPPACDGLGAEARAALGRSPGRAGRGPFAALELAYRVQGGCAHAVSEATIGYELEHKWLLLAQAFRDRDLHGTETVKVQISAVKFRRANGFQVGLRCRVDGADAEPQVIFGVWRRDRRGH